MDRNILKDLRDDRRREIERSCRIQDRIEAHIRGGPHREADAMRLWWAVCNGDSWNRRVTADMIDEATYKTWVQDHDRPTYRYPHWQVPVKIGT